MHRSLRIRKQAPQSRRRSSAQGLLCLLCADVQLLGVNKYIVPRNKGWPEGQPLFLSQEYLNRTSKEIEVRAQLVLKETSVRLTYILRKIAEERE